MKSRRVTDHLESETSVYHQKDQVHHLAQIDHTVEIIATLDKRDSPRLARDYSDWPLRLIQVMFRESLDQRPEQCRFTDTRWTDDTNNDRRRRYSPFVHSLALLARHLPLLWISVDQGDM